MRPVRYGPINLHTRDDEEPDIGPNHRIDFHIWIHAGDCSFCGQDGHRSDYCPNRPRRQLAPGVAPIICRVEQPGWTRRHANHL